MWLRWLMLCVLLAACEPFTVEPLPVAGPGASATPSAVSPTPSPLPKPTFTATPAYFKDIKGWTGSFKVTINHQHTAVRYDYQESYTADGVVRLFDNSAEGAFFSWPLPSESDNWKAQISLSSELNDSQNPDAVQHQSCRFVGAQDMDLGLSLDGGNMRLAGRLTAIEADCVGSSPKRLLPSLALTDKRRYWEFSYPLPATGTHLIGSYSFDLDGKQATFSWDINPVRN